MLEYIEETPSPAQPLQARFVPQEGRPREETVLLDWPFDYGNRRIDGIIVRRMTVAQVEAFAEAIKTEPKASPPMLFFPDGQPVTEDVLDQLDADDDLKLCGVMERFLPRSLRQATE